MDFEAPVDAWYVWLGVALVSLALVGIALSLPTQPPPDADRAANAIDRVSASPYQAEASYEHDAEEVRITTAQVSLRNDGGADHASVAFEQVTPIYVVSQAVENGGEIQDVLTAILHGGNPTDVLEAHDVETEAVVEAVAETNEYVAADDDEWQPATGVLTVRQVTLDGEPVVLVDA